MISGISESEYQTLLERVSATVIADQAVLKCALRGVAPTVDNVLLFVGDFFDPANDQFARLVEHILKAVDEAVP